MKNASARMLIVDGDVKMSTNSSRTCVTKRHSLGHCVPIVLYFR